MKSVFHRQAVRLCGAGKTVASTMSGSLISPALGIAVCVALILGFAAHPLSALRSLFTDTFTSAYYFGNMLNTAAFLMLAGAGSALSIKGGNMNLGGEGQVYAGGFVGCMLLNTLPFAAPLSFGIALLVSALTGAALALISAFLKELRGARVLLTTFLVSAAVIPLIDGLITASKNAGETNMLALPYIADAYKLPQILPPSPLTWSFFFALCVCLLLWQIVFHTQTGRKLQLWGVAPEFATYCGYSTRRNTYLTLAASGALHSLTGFFAIAGTYHTCHKGFYTNMGWNALNVALISKSNPLAVIPVSLLLSWIFTSASRVALTQGFGFDIAGIVQSVILFSIAIPFVRKALTKQTAGIGGAT